MLSVDDDVVCGYLQRYVAVGHFQAARRYRSARLGFDPLEIDVYNEGIAQHYDSVRDFLVLHYHATERDDSPFWRRCREMPVPASLLRRIELFRARGLGPDTVGHTAAVESLASPRAGSRLRPAQPGRPA